MYSFTTYIEIPYRYSPLEELARACDDEIEPDELVEVEVEVEYNPGYYVPMKRSGHPDNWEPADGESPEITSVMDPEGRNLLNVLSREQLHTLEDQAWEDQKQADEDAKLDAQIAAYEARMDYDEYGFF